MGIATREAKHAFAHFKCCPQSSLHHRQGQRQGFGRNPGGTKTRTDDVSLGRFGVWLAFRQEGWQHTPVLTFLRYFCKYRFSMPCTRAAAMAAGHTGQHWLQSLELQNALCVPENAPRQPGPLNGLACAVFRPGCCCRGKSVSVEVCV